MPNGTINQSNIKKILEDLKQEVTLNQKLIQKANQIDVYKNRKNIQITEICKIIDSYRDKMVKESPSKKYMVLYLGDPYLTVHILMQMIMAKAQLKIVHTEFMLGVNEILFSIFHKVLKAHKMIDTLNTQINLSISDIQEKAKDVDQIIVIGDTTIYQGIENLPNVKFYPYYNIALYCDDEVLQDLQKAIWIYANENQYEIEIIYEDTIDEAILVMMADNFIDTAILLTKYEENKTKFKEALKDKQVYVNENPFNCITGKIYNYFKE